MRIILAYTSNTPLGVVPEMLSAAKSEMATSINRVEVINSLAALADWFNTTPGVDLGNRTKKAIRYLVSVYGYAPYTGSIYRVLSIPKCTISSLPKVGKVVSLKTGRRKIQSWTTTPEAAAYFRGYLGNETPVVLVRLAENVGLQLLNMDWLRQVIRQLGVLAIRDKALALALQKLNKTIRPVGAKDDEKEVIMEMPTASRVTVLRVWDMYREAS